MGSNVQSKRVSKRRAAEENQGRGKTVLEIDLNNSPDEIAEVSHGLNELSNTAVSLRSPSVIQVETDCDTVYVDLDDNDDEVVFLSETNQVNRNEREANQSRRAGGGNGSIDVIHIDSDSHSISSGTAIEETATRLTLSNHPAGRFMALVHVLASDSYDGLENNHPSKRMNVGNGGGSRTEISPDPEEPTMHAFKCVVCLGPLVDETSTSCGHIFCQSCIKAAIKAQKKCPTCRRKLNMRNIHRVYLPGST